MARVLIPTIAIQAAPYVGQEVYVEGKTPGRVVDVSPEEKIARVRTAAGELVPIAWALLEIEEER